MLTRDCLVEALQNISGKSIPADVLKTCETTCDVLDAFNHLYNCAVIFSAILGSSNVTAQTTIVVKDANGNEISAGSDGKYHLKEGTYKYDATCEGAVAKTNETFTVTNADETNGTKTVIITFTAAA